MSTSSSSSHTFHNLSMLNQSFPPSDGSSSLMDSSAALYRQIVVSLSSWWPLCFMSSSLSKKHQNQSISTNTTRNYDLPTKTNANFNLSKNKQKKALKHQIFMWAYNFNCNCFIFVFVFLFCFRFLSWQSSSLLMMTECIMYQFWIDGVHNQNICSQFFF